MKSHTEIRMVDCEQRDFALKLPFQIRPGLHALHPLHVIGVTASPMSALGWAGFPFFQIQEVQREAPPLAFENFAPDLAPVTSAFKRPMIARRHDR